MWIVEAHLRLRKFNLCNALWRLILELWRLTSVIQAQFEATEAQSRVMDQALAEPGDHEGSPWSLGSYTEAKPHHGVVEAHPGVKEAHPESQGGSDWSIGYSCGAHLISH
jgi:hypothetical protein